MLYTHPKERGAHDEKIYFAHSCGVNGNDAFHRLPGDAGRPGGDADGSGTDASDGGAGRG